MLELPESAVIARQLNDTVYGRRIKEVETEHTHHGFAWYTGSPEEYAGIMEGKVFGRANGLGSMIEIELPDYRLVAGDGANLRYYEKKDAIPEKYQMRITFSDDSSLIITVQMYGGMLLFREDGRSSTADEPDREEQPGYSYYRIAKEKPQPLTEGFDFQWFYGLWEEADSGLSMKAFLATQQRIPGLGNGVLQDILLRAGMHPKRKLKTVPVGERRAVYDALVETLTKMKAGGGRNTEKTLFGENGGYSVMLSKKTVGKPCPYCGSVIQKAGYLGGTIYFCPECQK